MRYLLKFLQERNETNRLEISLNKNAFQWDAYHPLVDRIPVCTGQRVYVSQHALGRGVSAQGGVYARGCVSAWGVSA